MSWMSSILGKKDATALPEGSLAEIKAVVETQVDEKMAQVRASIKEELQETKEATDTFKSELDKCKEALDKLMAGVS